MPNGVITSLAAGLKLGEREYEEVSEFKYQCNTLTLDRSCDRGIMLRTVYEFSGVSQLNNAWRCSKYFLKLKKDLFNCNVVSLLTYGYKASSLSKDVEKGLVGFANSCLPKYL